MEKDKETYNDMTTTVYNDKGLVTARYLYKGGKTMETENSIIKLQKACEKLRDLSIKTVKPNFGIVNNVSNRIHPVIGREKMYSSMLNPCREINLRPEFLVWPEVTWPDFSVENTEWEFKSSSDDDINWNDIKDSVDYSEPLALITRKYRDYISDDKYIVVSKELMDKAKIVDMITSMPEVTQTISKRVFGITGESVFSEWVDWAKAVKAARWADPIKSTISVILPTV